MEYAPIVIFAFNRLESLQRTIESLKANIEAKDSDLIVYVDGARENKAGETEKVEAVRGYVATISGFKSLRYIFSEKNQGLAASVIKGVTDVINQYGTVIVLEDDLVLMPNFLAFMNQGLDYYKDNQQVMSVCGHSCKVKKPKHYQYDAYFFTRSSSWGWATWKDRWEDIDWSLNNWNAVKRNARVFNHKLGSDCYRMLKGWKDGRVKSWAIRFCYSQFLHNKLSVIPNISLVDNEGFTGDGTNCKRYSRFKFELNKKTSHINFRFPFEVALNKSLYRQAIWYHSIPIRIWSKIMYMVK